MNGGFECYYSWFSNLARLQQIHVFGQTRYTVIHGLTLGYSCKYTQIHGDTRSPSGSNFSPQNPQVCRSCLDDNSTSRLAL